MNEQFVADVAQRHGFSPAAVAEMLRAVVAARGRMAQFDHPEFGGRGQWLRGGMTMVSKMFDPTLKERVARLCAELAQSRQSAQPHADDRWPAALGRPNSAGAQNGMRYAYFAAARRLLVDDGTGVRCYDTLDHRIGGVAQAQSGAATLAFTSQRGTVDVATLPLARDSRPGDAADERVPDTVAAAPSREPDVTQTIEKLANLRAKGILTEDEFVAKKRELLGRL